ncbi:DUF7563 family protein [Natrinema soli]|uniref:DUF7563 family protein n=1 Tax=Natrinema soli TaxID=1930624 RepID=UPI003CCD9A66
MTDRVHTEDRFTRVFGGQNDEIQTCPECSTFSQLVEPLSLNDSIDELETTIDLYESFENSEDN